MHLIQFLRPRLLALFSILVFALGAQAQTDARDSYTLVNLFELVPATRMTEGGRAVFAPRPVRFIAQLAQLPTPQKSDYLKKVMEWMGIEAPLQVNHRVALHYGGDQALAAYVEATVAERIRRELKPGDERTFYAFHVYNNRYGPALVITSFEP